MGASSGWCADAVPRFASNLASQAGHRLGSACGCAAFLLLHPAAAGAAWSAARLQALQCPHWPTSLPLRLPARRPQIEKEAEQLLRFHPFKAQVVYGETCWLLLLLCLWSVAPFTGLSSAAAIPPCQGPGGEW